MSGYRELMTARLGRVLGNNEVVHHANGNPHDNRLENLMVLSRGAHNRLHRALRAARLARLANLGGYDPMYLIHYLRAGGKGIERGLHELEQFYPVPSSVKSATPQPCPASARHPSWPGR